MRFFKSIADISGSIIPLSAEEQSHIKAARIRYGEAFTVCDSAGTDYICRLHEPSGGTCAEIIGKTPSQGEPIIKCSVYTAMAKGDKLDLIVQKSVELGAFEIVLFLSERCVSTPDDKSAHKKAQRLLRISLEAAKQSGRGIVPAVRFAGTFLNAVKDASSAELPLFLYEAEDKTALKTALSANTNAKTVSLMSGPEGGFSAGEASLAAQHGLLSVTLGKRILRCETAPICALSAVMYHMDELGSIRAFS